MTTEDLIEKLKKTLGTRLQNIVAYGSVARGDHAPGFSDTNLLVLLDDLSVPTLQLLFEPIREWVADRNPAPLLFSKEQFLRSMDVFPIEFSEMIPHHRVLFGADPFDGVVFQKTTLRWQLEYELRVKSLHLRRLFLENAKEPKNLGAIFVKAVSSLTALMRAILEMKGQRVPVTQVEVWKAAENFLAVDVGMIARAQELRRQGLKRKATAQNETEDLYGRMLKTLDVMIDFVDQFKN